MLAAICKSVFLPFSVVSHNTTNSICLSSSVSYATSLDSDENILNFKPSCRGMLLHYQSGFSFSFS
jgi:hypothetical protein